MKFAALVIVLTVTAVGQVSGAGSQSVASNPMVQPVNPDWSPETIRLEHNSAKVRERIRLFIDCRNISDRPILVADELKNPRRSDLLYPLEVRDQNGNLAPETSWGRRARTGKSDPGKQTVEVGSYHERFIQPGETYSGLVELNALYDLTQPGTYTVQLVRRDEKGTVVFKSNTVELSIVK